MGIGLPVMWASVELGLGVSQQVESGLVLAWQLEKAKRLKS